MRSTPFRIFLRYRPPACSCDVFVKSACCELYGRRPRLHGLCVGRTHLHVGVREERGITVQTGFSPPAPSSPLALCFEVNVVTLKGSNVFGSANVKDLTASTLPANAQNGWALFDFTTSLSGTVAAHRLTSSAPVATFFGLPVVGFAAITFNNGALVSGTGAAAVNVRSIYAGTFPHKARTLITP